MNDTEMLGQEGRDSEESALERQAVPKTVGGGTLEGSTPSSSANCGCGGPCLEGQTSFDFGE